LFFCNLKFLYD